MDNHLQIAVDKSFPVLQEHLEALVRIPSISAKGFDPNMVRHSANLTAELIDQVGVTQLALLEIDGAHPAVFGERRIDTNAPTVLLYAHHDVQPPGNESEWHSPPFEPVEQNGRLFGRGTSDDKAGIVVHLAALDAIDSHLPINIKLFIEGEEEIGSLHLDAFLNENKKLLNADFIVIADAANWRVGSPALTTSLRGLVDCVIEVRTLQHGVHSGLFGGVLPDAISTLSRLLATLHDATGKVAVNGLIESDSEPLDLTETEIRNQGNATKDTRIMGNGSLTSRLWSQPSISILAMDVPIIDQAINQLVPVARAKISLRIAPGDDPETAMQALTKHLEAHVPWGAELTITPGAKAAPFSIKTTGPGYDAFRLGIANAWGAPPVEIGIGGSIPFVAAFSETFPEASIILTGVGDPTSKIHGPNESQDLEELRRACLAESVALAKISSFSRSS